MHYLKRQGVYACIGLVLLVVASRMRFRRCARSRRRSLRHEHRAAGRGARVGRVDQRREALDRRRPARLPAVRAREARARASGPPRISRARPAAADARGARASRSAWSSASSAAAPAEPDLGTAIALVLMLGGDAARLRHARAAARRRAAALVISLGLAAIWFEPYRRARLLQLPRPVARRAGRRLPDRPGDDRARLRRPLRRGPRPGRRQGQLPARGAHGHDLRGHRRGARPGRRDCA